MSGQLFEVGNRVVHRLFGEGLVVDVRKGVLHDVLEVVFPCGVKRIASTYPLVEAREISTSKDDGGGSEAGRQTGQGAAGIGEYLSRSAASEWQAGEMFEWDEDGQRVLKALRAASFDSPEDFALRMEAERLSLDRGFTQLVALQNVRDVDRHQHQIKGCLRVMRDMGGRALLADHCGDFSTRSGLKLHFIFQPVVVQHHEHITGAHPQHMADLMGCRVAQEHPVPFDPVWRNKEAMSHSSS